MMAIIMFIIFLLTDLSMVGIFAFVYSGKEEYSEGMILGVHIPKEEIENEEVRYQANQYKRLLKKYNLWNFLFGTLVCFLCFLNFIAFIVLWMIWLFEYIIAGSALIMRAHRKMYDIKMKHNWVIEGNTHMIHIDTTVCAMSEKLPISHWFNLPAIACISVTLLIPQVRIYFGSNQIQWIFPATVLFTGILFWVLHLWILHRKNVVYSNDSSVNLAMNRMEKRTFSIFMLSSNYLNLLGWGYLSIMIVLKHWLYSADYWIYIILQMIPAFVMVFGVIYMHKKRKEVFAMDSEPLIVDDDEYWKNGWYNNPNDSHLWVQDRMCSTNYSMNMAKPAAKITTMLGAVFTVIVIVATMAILICFDNANITFQMHQNQVKIDAAIYHTQFERNEIKSVTILKQMPEDDFARTNGGDTDKYLIGHFTGKRTGKCMMYLYRGYYPILKIKLTDKTIYINSKINTDVKEWYQKLAQDK